MKIGIIRETKTPEDNRVALVPSQIEYLMKTFPELEFVVQPSPTRAYSDREYSERGINVADEMGTCDVLLGIKEATIDSLIPGKHYFFFGHIAKLQLYNKPLLREIVNKGLTFSDWEYLVNDRGERLVAFGWYAGVVGAYYTLRGWGLRTGSASLPKPHLNFTKEEIIDNIRKADLLPAKILVTGEGRVSQGVQYALDQIGATRLSIKEYLELTCPPQQLTYAIAGPGDLVKPKDPTRKFSFDDFVAHPDNYESNFERFASTTDILISGHFWLPNQPVYLTKEMCLQPDFQIKMIGDITCDIEGSIKPTLRSSTHAKPFYDYDPATGKEAPAFSSDQHITIMAVDTCPNALPRETSEFFGGKFIESVLPELMAKGMKSEIVNRASLVVEGKINEPFSYLSDYLKSNQSNG